MSGTGKQRHASRSAATTTHLSRVLLLGLANQSMHIKERAGCLSKSVRKPDHCAAEAGSTGQSKQRAGSGATRTRAVLERALSLPTLPPRLRRAACFLCCSRPAPVLPEAPAAVGRRQRAQAWTTATGWRPGAVRTTTDLTASGAALC
eukprot:scaffold82269_cov60-Phaeocystis_antarctica.AAC.2